MNKYVQLYDNADKYLGLLQSKEEILSFMEYLDTEVKPQNCLEIGVYQGASFYLWANLLPDNALKIAIDDPNGKFGAPYRREFFEVAINKHNIKTFKPNIHVHYADSNSLSTIEWVEKKLNGEKLDFLFIDGDHQYEGVKLDYNNYKRFVKDGGLIVFHDIKDTEFHKDRLCTVWEFWQELEGDKREFCDDNKFGGIGVLKYKEETI